MPIPVRRCDAACGAEIVFDLSQPIDDAAFAEIERHFHDNIIVFFRDQQLSEEQQIAFSRRFGELEIHIVKKYLLPGLSRDPADLEHPQRQRRAYRPGRCRVHLAQRHLLPALSEPLLAALCEGGAASRRPAARRHGVRQHDRRLRGAARGDEAPPRRAQGDPPLFDAAPGREQPAPEADRGAARRDARTSRTRSCAPIPIPGARRYTSPPANASASRACPRTRRSI